MILKSLAKERERLYLRALSCVSALGIGAYPLDVDAPKKSALEVLV